jgi:hypothetical protein
VFDSPQRAIRRGEKIGKKAEYGTIALVVLSFNMTV